MANYALINARKLCFGQVEDVPEVAITKVQQVFADRRMLWPTYLPKVSQKPHQGDRVRGARLDMHYQ